MTSTISPPDAPPDVIGSQRPRICSIPPRASSAGTEAVELAALAGLDLDPWQAFVLENSLGERADGKWAAFEVGLVVSRQNGKGSILEARELAGLFLLGERFIVHSAHQFDTSVEQFRRLLYLIENTPDLDKRVKRVSKSHGEEGIELLSGQRIRFRTRTSGGGRGFTADCIILDEAMRIPESTLAALLPTLAARPNPQIWYTGSAVDQETEEHGVVLARIRERGVAGDDPSLAYFEWSTNLDLEKVTPEAASEIRHWADANPGMGIRISEEHIANEYASTRGGRTFAVERLGAGDWPSTDPGGARVIDAEDWDSCLDEKSQIEGPVSFAFDVTPDRAWTCISVAGHRADGLPHIEVVEHRRGTRWVPERVAELVKRHRCPSVYCDAYGPAGSLTVALEDLNIEVVALSAKDVAQACGIFYDAVSDGQTLRHLGTPELTAAVSGARTRPLGDAWAWSRKGSDVDISPLVSATTALWGLKFGPKPRPKVVSLADIAAEMDSEEG